MINMFKKANILLLIVALVFSCVSLTACESESEDGETVVEAGANGVVYIYNYGDYVDPDIIDMFEAETGIKVIYDTFDTNEEMYPIVASNSVTYDVVCSGEYMAQKLIENDLVAELNFDNIPNFKYINETSKTFVADYDPGNVHSVPYTWGTVGIAYNSTKIPDGEITSWSDLWKEEYYDNVMMMDSIRDSMMVALKIKGYSCNTTEDSELREATDLLIEQKNIVYKYATDAIRDLLLNESADIGVIYSGEAIYCQEDNEDIHYVVPSEGTNIWFDIWTVPKASKNKENAEAWINFMCRPDIALKTYEYLHYGTPNSEAEKLVKELYPEDLDNQALFPDTSDATKFEVYHYLGKEADEKYNKFWKDFKAS